MEHFRDVIVLLRCISEEEDAEQQPGKEEADEHQRIGEHDPRDIVQGAVRIRVHSE